MRTPAGTECKYFYGNYFRGRSQEECRLLGGSWISSMCRNCPVPSIILANACENMHLRLEVSRPLVTAFRRRVRVTAFCEKTGRSGFDPHIGCGECHPFPLVFEVKGDGK